MIDARRTANTSQHWPALAMTLAAILFACAIFAPPPAYPDASQKTEQGKINPTTNKDDKSPWAKMGINEDNYIALAGIIIGAVLIFFLNSLLELFKWLLSGLSYLLKRIIEAPPPTDDTPDKGGEIKPEKIVQWHLKKLVEYMNENERLKGENRKLREERKLLELKLSFVKSELVDKNSREK